MGPNAETANNEATPSNSKSGPAETIDNEAIDIAEKHFPGALRGSGTLEKVAKVVEQRGYTDTNTLYAQSICPDEINHEITDVSNLFAGYFGEVFHLGGLAGIPFTGKTGFAAFSHHVPEDGHCFVLMAPHIGISETLKLGKYSRDGQIAEGSACGAAVGALGHCCSGKEMPCLGESFDDYQMSYIITEINKRKESILSKTDENERQAELANQTWAIGKTMLDKVASTAFGSDSSTLLLLTGIQINMPRPHEDFFQPLSFELHRKTGEVVDLLEETFG
jgi:hypothetical protein